MRGRVECLFTYYININAFEYLFNVTDGSEMPEQQRQRFMLEKPSSEGLPCPELFEFRPCLNMPHCVDYMWSTSEWSVCLFASSSVNGGVGYRSRGEISIQSYIVYSLCLYKYSITQYMHALTEY